MQGAIMAAARPKGRAAGGLGLKTNLIAWWELDEASGNALDSHTNAFTLTDTNTVTSGTGVGGVGTARLFTEANNEYFEAADNALLRVGTTNDWAVAGWFYLTDEASTHGLVAKVNGNSYGYRLVYGADRFSFWMRGSTGATTVTADTFGAVSATTWYFLVAQYIQSTGVISISVNNGAADTASHNTAGDDGWNDVFRIGYDALVSGAGVFNGRAQRVAIWRKASGGSNPLSAAQITALYNAGAGLSYASLT